MLNSSKIIITILGLKISLETQNTDPRTAATNTPLPAEVPHTEQ